MNFSSLFRRKNITDIRHDFEVIEQSGKGMKRNLRLFDLTSLAIAAIIGAGIFSTVGTAAMNGGPAVSLLFVLTAIACSFSALAYARFASAIPISGSAYTYTYTSFGEILAWIIGWDLIMEYAIGNIAVAISWSDYFSAFMAGVGLRIPEYLTVDYLSASRAFEQFHTQISSGAPLSELSYQAAEAYKAYVSAPQINGIRIIADLPAFSIVFFISVLVFIGIRESKNAGNIMVIIKLLILMTVISAGAFFIKPENWSPFAPNGLGGVLKGVAGVFFAYIGFDAITTTAEECKNPSRDLPKAMILAIIVTTIVYVLVSLVLTGMVNYSELGVGDPLAFVFAKVGLNSLSGIIAVSALIAMTGVLLVFQVGQPRIWMSMSRDGLLPKKFSKLHPRFKTPSFSTIIAGIIVAVPALFTNLTEMTDLTSIGTLFAFVLVSGGVIIMDAQNKIPEGAFKIPYLNSRYWFPLFLAFIALIILVFFPDFKWSDCTNHPIMFTIFLIISTGLGIFAILKKWSFLPFLGLLVNFYLMAELGVTNWLRFLLWLAVGLVIYFAYGRKHSLLNRKTS